MADEGKTVAPTSAEEAPVPAKKGIKPLVLIGGIGVPAVVIGIVLALFVVNPMMVGHDGDKADVASEPAGRHESSRHGASDSQGDQQGKGHAENASIYSVADIVINPAGTGGSRFLSASFGFELRSSEAVRAFEEKEAVIRDALITILSSKTVAQLTDTREKEIARLQIKRRVAQLMDTDDLTGVYYTDFVLQ